MFVIGKAAVSDSIRRSLTVVASGNLIGQILGFVSTLIVIRGISVESFGRYGVALAFIAVVAQIGDFGINTAFVGVSSVKNIDKFDDNYQAVLRLKLVVLFVLMVLGVVFSVVISRVIYGDSRDWLLVINSVFASSMWILFGFVQAVYQARGRFGLMVAIYVSTNAVRCVLLGVGVLLGFSVNELISMIGVAYLIGSVIGLFGMRLKFRKISISKIFHSWSVVLNIGKWTGIAIVFASFTDAVHVFFVQRLSNGFEAGIFAGAWQLSSIFSLLSGAIATVLLGKMSNISSGDDIRRWLSKSYKIFPYLLCVCVVLLIGMYPVIRYSLGGKYAQSYVTMCILMLGFVIALPFNHLWYIFIGLNRSWVLALSNAIQLIVVVVADIILVSNCGSMGAAMAMLVVRLLSVIVLIGILRRLQLNGAMVQSGLGAV